MHDTSPHAPSPQAMLHRPEPQRMSPQLPPAPPQLISQSASPQRMSPHAPSSQWMVHDAASVQSMSSAQPVGSTHEYMQLYPDGHARSHGVTDVHV